jgi:transketolase
MVKMALNLVDAGNTQASIWSAPSIKPINVSQVVEVCKGSDLIITIEEHSVIGGLGSVITEIACEFSPLKILRIGVKDRFSHCCGTYEYLLKEHNLDLDSITTQINHFIDVE